jgi:hypothetical protein
LSEALSWEQGPEVAAAPVVETVVPNPKLKLLDQINEVMRLKQIASQSPPFVYHRPDALSLRARLKMPHVLSSSSSSSSSQSILRPFAITITRTTTRTISRLDFSNSLQTSGGKWLSREGA